MKKNLLPFVLLFALYTGTGAAALISFHINGSYLSRQQSITDATDVSTQDSDVQDDVSETVTESENSIETLNESEASVETQELDESDTSDKTEETTEVEAPETDTSVEEESTTETEASAEPEERTDDKTYYAFTVIDGVTGVRIRETADRNSNIISYIDGGKSGYVLERGDTRTKILTKKGTIGYIYNEYITIHEISKKEFPKEYR